MGSTDNFQNHKPHAVCIPYPAQGHINPMTKLAKLLNSRGIYITFVNTEYNHNRLLKSRGPNSLDGLPSFKYESIPDGLPPSDMETTQHLPSLCVSIRKNFLALFRDLLKKLNSSPDLPPVSCIVSDAVMSFTLDAAEELGIPDVCFWAASSCSYLGFLHYRQLIHKGYIPLKDPSYLTNGYLETVLDWIPGMKDIRFRDLPSFVRTTDLNEILLNFMMVECESSKRASAIILNTYDALEHDVLQALSSILPPIYTIGPLPLLLDNHVTDQNLKSIGSNLWKEEPYCLEWLDSKEPNSVVYISFGSVTVMTPEQLVEFAWGLANSKKAFLWVIRPDLVSGEASIVPPEFSIETKERGLLANWCPQDQVLRHPAIAGFLTHNGWNSTMESISCGVPVICWPFFADQQTNCRYCCREWEIGMEIEDVERGKIEKLIRELMDGEKGKKMKEKVMEWKKLGEVATIGPNAKSLLNLDNLINQFLLSPTT
ncbi:hypothetical protein UlMin_030134 [Ulmus minor]